MFKRLSIILLLFTLVLSVSARTRQESKSLTHEIRIGWGDQLFEQIAWHDSKTRHIMPDNYTETYKENHRYSQHWYLQYLYNINSWFSYGCEIDYSLVRWDLVDRDGTAKEIGRKKNEYLNNLLFLLPMRFTYLHKKHIEMYSGLSIGVDINSGTETDEYDNHTLLLPAADFRFIGIKFTKGPWSASADIGGTIAMRDQDHIALAFSRLFLLSLGYSFNKYDIQRWFVKNRRK